MKRWATPEGYPCTEPTAPVDRASLPHLVFYFDRPFDHPETRKAVESIRRFTGKPPLQQVLANCFSNMSFSTASLTAKESTNSRWFDPLRNLVHTEGSNGQFFAAFDLHSTYRHMFYMEPDTWPLRANWLPRLDMLTQDPGMWMRGSMMRYEPRFVLAPEPFRSLYTHHLNGNGIYELHDPCFARYRNGVRREYGAGAFDVAMTMYRMRRGRYELDHALAHRFVATDVVIDLGVEEYKSLEQLRQRFPDTYLVHGKYEFLAEKL
jgi:hypothetical protein